MVVKTQAIDFKDALLTTMYTQKALIKPLLRGGIITEKELLRDIKRIKNRRAVSLL